MVVADRNGAVEFTAGVVVLLSELLGALAEINLEFPFKVTIGVLR